jgi:hypothetical protein
MSLSPEILRRLAALNLPVDGLQGVLVILAELQSADDARRAGQRERKARSRAKSRPSHVTVTGHGRDSHSDAPSQTLPEASKDPEASASGPTQAELERELFRRGRQVCGKASGGLIASLLKAKQHDVALARSVVETAATKQDPREYVAASTRVRETPAPRPGSKEDRAERNFNALQKFKQFANWSHTTDQPGPSSDLGQPDASRLPCSKPE